MANSDNATSTAPTTTVTTKAESNGRQLPGRVVLIGLVSFVAIFLDFESSSLTAFRGAARSDVSDFDAQQSGIMKQGGGVREGEELGRMQQYQLEKQWDDYTRRVNHLNATSGPEEIVIEEEEEPNHLNATQSAPLRVSNASSLVEVIIIEAVNETIKQPSTNRTSKKKKRKSNNNVTEQIVAIDVSVDSPSECFPHNSKAWMTGTRWSNADVNLTDDFVYHQILTDSPLLHPSYFKTIASQTICHEDSRFRNPSSDEWDIQNDALIDEWEVRLLYLAIHHYNHAPAVPEARARQACSRDATSTIPKMDYECPNAKFLVANIAPSGLGAAFRLGAVSTILMAIATDRIPIFVNNLDGGGAKFLKNPSQLASCPRGDHQCFYLPTTPCTLLAKDIRNAMVLPEYDARDLRRQGILFNTTYADATILVTEPRLNPPKQWSIQTKIQAKLYAIAMQLIDGMRDAAPPAQLQVLEAAAARIQLDNATIAYGENKNASSTEYIYSNRYTKTAHATLMYLMRPNRHYQRLSDEIVASVVPKDVDRSRSIGLPIRGSDKCTAESLCYGFDTYMKLVNRMWEEQLKGGDDDGNKTKGELFLTTEDKTILEARKAYARNDSFPYRFIVNQKDVLQGSGKPKSYKDRADAIMLSSIVSMKLQLQSKFVVGNCCSNFHLMIFDMVREGCGAVRDSQAMCLQEHPDPEFHICCGWTRTDECDRIHEGRAEETRRIEEAKQKEKESSKKSNATQV
mmetsp:Transcript_5138/g.8437  ORF Transcript_5138/g.8437 Transcript_5138/m.8437 type:complete len:742 (+) Transcript_5138:42-2267(+)